MESTKEDQNKGKEGPNQKKIQPSKKGINNQGQKQKIDQPPNKKSEKDKIISNNNYNQAEILSEINSLKKELELKSNLINNLISEVNKQNLALKDYQIEEKSKNNMNLRLMQSQEEIKNLKSMNSSMKKEIENINLEKEEYKKKIDELNSKLDAEKLKNNSLSANNEELNNKIEQK